MAIAALHKPLVDAVLEGHGEFRPLSDMAAVTQLGLTLRQQKFRRCGLVYRVTVRAGDVIQGVRRGTNVRPVEAVRMTTKTGIQSRLRTKLSKSNDSRLSAMRLNVCLGRPMTTLTTGVGRFFFSDRNTLEMRIFVELEPYVGVAGFTGIAADVSIFWWIGFRRVRALGGYRNKDEKRKRLKNAAGSPLNSKRVVSTFHSLYATASHTALSLSSC
ncbi:MAG TPA: hypothetical protein VGG97_18030 [Bryobacteraceae bacterium]|jgi:hypothetical protein